MNRVLKLLVVVACLGIAGCFLAGEKPAPGTLPEGTVLHDSDGDGFMDILAVDADGDGQADVVVANPDDPDAKPEVQIIPGTEPIVRAAAVDTKGPEALAWVAGAAGVPGLGLLAALWRKQKWATAATEIVRTVQDARRRLKDANAAEALAMVDKALETQTGSTTAMVKSIKSKHGVKSVSHS